MKKILREMAAKINKEHPEKDFFSKLIRADYAEQTLRLLHIVKEEEREEFIKAVKAV